jgi:DNA-binding transcriptional LysR family regulator
VALTADGEVFLGNAKRIIASIEDAHSDLSGGTANIKGKLRVTGSASFGRRYMAPYIAEFQRAYPDVRARLELSDGIVDIVEQGFDPSLRIGKLTSLSMVARKLAENPRLLVASPAYLEDAERPLQPEDLAKHNCIVLAENRNWKLPDESGEIHEISVSGNFTTDYGEVIVEAALADTGIGLRSLWNIRHLLAEGALLPVLEDYTDNPHGACGLSTRRGRWSRRACARSSTSWK